jgi:outer membrane receptor protein involved in Fe transport
VAAGLGPSAGGQCSSAGNSFCVPVNLWGGPGSMTPDQLTTLGGYTGINNGYNQQAAVQANLAGELFRLGAQKPVGLALGYEYRHELGANVPNPVAQAGLDTDFSGHLTKGGFYVNEGYAELSLPLLDGLPGVEDLEVTGAARLVDYNTFGTNATYKLGARYRPLRDVTFRGTWSTGFRAPGILDLYQGDTISAEAAVDPCSAVDATKNPTLFRQCGSAANNASNKNQINSTIGGNPALRPEKATTYTVGVVLEPSFAKGLSLTADYYDVQMNDLIGAITTPIILQGCYPGDGKTPNADYCKLISRGPDGQISNVSDLSTNVGTLEVSGIDLTARYSLPTELGRFSLVVDSTILLRYDQQIASGLVSAAGNYDLGLVLPMLKVNPGLFYNKGGLTAGLTGRFEGGFHECATPAGKDAGKSSASGLCYQNPKDDNGKVYPVHEVSSYFTLDLNAAYQLRSSYGATTLAVGVRNLLDQDPPRVYNTVAATNSDPSAYDYVGREIYFRATHQF